ncbi:hypothetical protein M5689_000066 [Euphorbia peplus]|nr:hypothetical protein M5689_000066 [Euphorbia peplus]
MAAPDLDVGASMIMAMVFLSSIIIIPFIAAVLSASRRPLNGTDVHNIDLEQAQSELQNQQMHIYSENSQRGLKEPLIHGLSSIPSKPPIHALIPIPSKPLPSSLSSTGPSDPLTPTLISIGPSHFSAAEKLPMDHLKSDYLQHCLGRLPQKQQQSDSEAKMKCITEFIREKKESICQCYDGYDSKCKDGYDKIFEANVMEDSFFIFELFLRELNPSEHSNDQLISYQKNRNGVREDLVLITNQLPYFFLKDLYGFVFGSAACYPSFDSLTQNYVGKLPLITGNQEGLVDSCCSGFSHCVEDCFRYLFYCFWTRHLKTCCNSRDSDDHDVAISTEDSPIFQFTNLYRDRVVEGNTLHQGSTPSSSTGNRPPHEASSSSSSAGRIGVDGSPGPISSSSTRNRSLHERSSSSTADPNIHLGGDSFSSSREKRPLYKGFSPSSETAKRTANGGSISSRGDRFIAIQSATKLQQGGAKLKASDDGCMINIKYENGILSIPPLKFYDYTERTLRNLIAYEQRAFQEQAHISSYIKFMEFLVKSKADADLLIDKGIIVNGMAGGDKEVKELLQRLCKDIVLPSVFYPKVCLQLKKHRGNCWYRILAEFVNKFLNKPISRIVTPCAIMVFFLVILRFILPYIGTAPPPPIHSG